MSCSHDIIQSFGIFLFEQGKAWFYHNFDFPPEKKTLLGFLAIQSVALSTGYPLIFHGLGRMTESRELRDHFENLWRTMALRWSAILGTLFTGLVLLLVTEERSFGVWWIASLVATIFFCTTTCLLYLVIGNVIQHSFRPWEIAIATRFAPKNSCRCRRVFRRSGRRRKDGQLESSVEKLRQGLTLIGEQIRALARSPGHKRELDQLCDKFREGLSREVLASLEKDEWGTDRRDARRVNNSDSTYEAVKSLVMDAMDNLRLSYLAAEAENVENRSARQILTSTFRLLLIDHSRKTEDIQTYLVVSQKLCVNVLQTIVVILKRLLDSKQQKDLTLALSTYNDIVFLAYKTPFELQLLGQFDNFFEQVAYVVSNSKKREVMEVFLEYVNDGPRFHPGTSGSPHELFSAIDHSPTGLAERLEEFAREQRRIFTVTERDEFKRKWQGFIGTFPATEESSRVSQSVLEASEGWLKLNHLQECLFSVGSRCLMDDRYDFIKIMWQIHQPPDSTATYGENTLLPSDLNSALEHYLFVRRPHDRDHEPFWQGHHGKGGWFRQYMVLHLAAIFEGRLEDVSWKRISDNSELIARLLAPLTPSEMQSVKYDTEELLRTARNLTPHEKCLEALNFKLDESGNTIINKVIPLLEKIIASVDESNTATQSSAPIDPEMAKSFSARVYSGLEDGLQLSRMSREARSGPADSPISTRTFDLPRLGMVTWTLREVFIKDWYVDCDAIGSSFGEDLAAQVEWQVVANMVENSKRVNYDEFMEILRNNELKDHILISTSHGIGYSSVWRKDFEFSRAEDSSNFVREYRGKFTMGNKALSVYAIGARGHIPFPRESVLVMPRAMLGQIQLVPDEVEVNAGIDWKFNEVIGEGDTQARLKVGEWRQGEIEKLLLTPLRWLQGSEELTEEQKRLWLKSHVLLALHAKLLWRHPSNEAMYLVSPERNPLPSS